MPKAVFYELPTRLNGPLFSPNTVVIRLALLHKQIPFTTEELPIQHLKSNFTARFKGAPAFAPMVEFPVDENGNVATPDENGDCRGKGLLVQDTMAIASLLDQFYPEAPSLFLPEVEDVDVKSKEWRMAYNYAMMTKQGLGTSTSRWASHFELSAEAVARNMEETMRNFFISDAKNEQKDAWTKLCDLDKARLIGETRRSLLPISSLLSPSSPVVSSETALSLERIPSSTKALYLTSPLKPGIVDYLLLGRFVVSYSVDLELNRAIWSSNSDKARAWLKNHQGGRWEVKEEIGEWDGDVELLEVEAWAERLLDAHSSHVRQQMNRERR